MTPCSYVCVYVRERERERDREGEKSVTALMCECQKCNYNNVCLFVNVCVCVWSSLCMLKVFCVHSVGVTETHVLVFMCEKLESLCWYMYTFIHF